MSAQGGAGCRAPTSLRTMSALDYGWWASDGPTAGYLARRTSDALEQSPDAGRGQVRHAHVQVLRLPAADAIDISVARASGTHGISPAHCHVRTRWRVRRGHAHGRPAPWSQRDRRRNAARGSASGRLRPDEHTVTHAA